MDFFERQDVARRKTGLLVLYFCLAVLLIVAGIYLTTAVIFNAAQSKYDPHGGSTFELWNPMLFLCVSGITLGVIALSSLFKISMLRSGGAAVAETLGGRLIESNTRDLDERIVLNVVEEMAIASGIPVPPVYILDEEGINAFAAGYSPNDAVIGISKGCSQMLSRDELQGVIAHEFSHILNGDMRLNIRLIGIVHGILVIALTGYVLIRVMGSSRHSRSSSGKGGGAIFLFGLALCVIGCVGVFFGKLIKSAVSRQREFLADSSAVQFTRNPSGIAGALKKIGGLASGARIESPHAEQVSHMFFGNAMKASFLNVMSTHPPLDVRIQRLEPSFDGEFPKVVRQRRTKADLHRTQSELEQQAQAIKGRKAAATSVGRRRHSFPFQPAQAIGGIGAPGLEHFMYAAALISSMPEPMVEAARESFGARSVIYGLLLDDDLEIRERQIERLAEHADPAVFEQTKKLMPQLEHVSPEMRLPLVEMALPALRNLSQEQYQSFRSNVKHLIMADEKIELFEYVLQRMLLNHLDGQFQMRKPVAIKHRSIRSLLGQCTDLLSKLAYVGQTDDARAAEAFTKGVQKLFEPQSGSLEMTPRDHADLNKTDLALNELAAAAPQVKKRVLQACATCIGADGQTTVEEAELLRVIADSLDCPMPPLLTTGESPSVG